MFRATARVRNCARHEFPLAWVNHGGDPGLASRSRRVLASIRRGAETQFVHSANAALEILRRAQGGVPRESGALSRQPAVLLTYGLFDTFLPIRRSRQCRQHASGCGIHDPQR